MLLAPVLCSITKMFDLHNLSYLSVKQQKLFCVISDFLIPVGSEYRETALNRKTYLFRETL
jgi:hypothetical protein